MEIGASVKLNTQQEIKGLYCLNDLAYEGTIQFYNNMIRRFEPLLPINVFPHFIIDLRTWVYVVSDGTHRAIASFQQGVPLECLIVEEPEYNGRIYKLLSIPLCIGNEQNITRRRHCIF